jgi:N-acyl amino acid synthase of PEP-CTERM/exosortase system
MTPQIFQLRYQVYCIERGFLDPGSYPDSKESDEYDDYSAHFSVENRRGEVIAYTRLVPPSPATGRFPWSDRCMGVFEGVELPAPEQAAEISRLMVRSDYRRSTADRALDDECPVLAPPSASAVSTAAPLVLALYRQVYRHCLESGIRYWYAAMEKALTRSLARMGFKFERIGEEMDYFGPVAPYLHDLREMETYLGVRDPMLLAWLQRPDLSND